MRPLLLTSLSALLFAGCNAAGDGAATAQTSAPAGAAGGKPFQAQEVAKFSEPWAMTFVPGTPYSLITEKRGRLMLREEGGRVVPVAGVPAVAYGGQGGLGDVVLHPDFADNGLVYLSYAEAGAGGKGAAVGRGRLITEGSPRLEGWQVIWRQEPKVEGNGHFGHRIAFGRDGMMYISSGERQKFDPAQADNQNLGKIIRLTEAGGIPSDNPFQGMGRIPAQIWSKGHRNPLGIAFDGSGQLWTHEMGPEGGDEFNRIERGSNYGYPIVSNGDHYDGRPIPDHDTRPEFNAPEITWTPVISPAGLIIYSGSMFPAWRGSALLGGLSGQALIRVAINGTSAREAERWDMGARIREVEQGPDGAVYVLEDERGGSGGRLLKLTPAR